jgi:hypothetical protein
MLRVFFFFFFWGNKINRFNFSFLYKNATMHYTRKKRLLKESIIVVEGISYMQKGDKHIVGRAISVKRQQIFLFPLHLEGTLSSGIRG